jgi:uncharacterized MAPEG superfamily protein
MSECFRGPCAVVFVASVVLLCVEMMSLAFATPLLRTKRNVWLNDEDAKRFAGTVADVEDRDVARLVRVHRSLLENFAPFFALGVAWIALGAPSRTGMGLFATFALARSAHVVFYLSRRGRLRTASHTLSFLVLLALVVGVVWAAVRVLDGRQPRISSVLPAQWLMEVSIEPPADVIHSTTACRCCAFAGGRRCRQVLIGRGAYHWRATALL